MEDTTKGAMGMWRHSVRELEAAELREGRRPGAKPASLRGAHWTAYKAVLADLEWRGSMTREQLVGRMNRLRRTMAASALRRGGAAYVHVLPRG